MVNFNGALLDDTAVFLNHENRGLRYGDSLFEAIRVVGNTVFFWEDHYLRLMASMRILRMEIPMHFTMEFLKDELLKTIVSTADKQNFPARVRLTVFRNNGGLYSPKTHSISYIIEVKKLDYPFYVLEKGRYEIELFKDFFVNSGLLSTLKTNNRIINVLGSVYARENDYDNCLLLNQDRKVIEALNGNIFLVSGNRIKTPPIKDGCLNGILRKQMIRLLDKLDHYELEETSVSPFELQKADEMFITNAITGIQSVTRYRKKTFDSRVALDLIGKLNAAARLVSS